MMLYILSHGLLLNNISNHRWWDYKHNLVEVVCNIWNMHSVKCDIFMLLICDKDSWVMWHFYLLSKGCPGRYWWSRSLGGGTVAVGPPDRAASCANLSSPGPCGTVGMGWRAVSWVAGKGIGGRGGLLWARLITGMLESSEVGDEEGRGERTMVEVELDVDVDKMLVFGGEAAGSSAAAFSSTLAVLESCNVAGLLGFVVMAFSVPLALFAAGLLVQGEWVCGGVKGSVTNRAGEGDTVGSNFSIMVLFSLSL